MNGIAHPELGRMTAAPTTLQARLGLLLIVLVGVAGFLAVAGHRALDPTNIAWISGGDAAMHYVGWLFFRSSSWMFPLGLSPGLGLELSSSIVYGDSNPLLAFLFKPFSPWLPATFQYFGIWVLICFVLQAWLGSRLVGLATRSILLRAFGAGLFVFAPPFLWRINAHLNLVGHFLILAALYLALDQHLKRRWLAWAALLAAATLVHGYLLGMVGVIWLADLAGRLLARRATLLQTARDGISIGALVALVAWQAGYFAAGGMRAAVQYIGYGYFRMNVLSLIDASGWSYFLPDLRENSTDYEGFAFLGLGVLFLLLTALPALVSGRVDLFRKIAKFPVLLLALAAMTAFALSYRISFADMTFEVLPAPSFSSFAHTFRASGRMVWPLFYMVVFVAIYSVSVEYRRRTAAVLLGVALLLQAVDTSAGWLKVRADLMREPNTVWSIPLVDPFWEQAATRYARLRWIMPVDVSPHWRDLSWYAGMHKMATDAVHLARIGEGALAQARLQAAETLETGNYDPDTLYVLDGASLRQAIATLDVESDLLALIDGYIVVAPGWKACAECSAAGFEISATLGGRAQ